MNPERQKGEVLVKAYKDGSPCFIRFTGMIPDIDTPSMESELWEDITPLVLAGEVPRPCEIVNRRSAR